MNHGFGVLGCHALNLGCRVLKILIFHWFKLGFLYGLRTTFFGHWTSDLRIYKNRDISLVSEAFLRVGKSWIWSAELTCFENAVISLIFTSFFEHGLGNHEFPEHKCMVFSMVLQACLNTGLETMNSQNSKCMIFHWFYK